MEKKAFSIRIGRHTTVNGQVLASMDQKEAIAYFKKNKNVTEDQIKTAHKEAKEQAKA